MPFGLPSPGRISTSVCVGLCVSVRVQSFIQFCLMLPSNDNARQCVFYVSIKRVLWALLQRAIMLRVFRVLTDSHIRRLAFWVRRRTKFHQHQHHTRQVQAELKLSRRIRLNDSVSFFAPLNLHSTSCLAKFINTKVVGTHDAAPPAWIQPSARHLQFDGDMRVNACAHVCRRDRTFTQLASRALDRRKLCAIAAGAAQRQ